MRWSEAEYQRFLRHGPDAVLSEKAWQAAVLRLLRQHGYTCIYHTFDSRKSQPGFPDVVAAHEKPGHPLLLAELKTATGKLTVEQARWQTTLAQCTGVQVAVWRPAHLPQIVAVLKEPPHA